MVPMDAWPYPFWIAHRGAGKLAPENTLAAFRRGAGFGFRMFECDVKLSADGVPFLLHDATLERTTSGQGRAADLAWAELQRLDAGSWLGSAHAGARVPSLEEVARFVIDGRMALNVEVKPTPGQEAQTGRAVAEAVGRHWQGAAPLPLLSSFSVAALESAMQAQPGLPRALLLDERWPGWEAAARRLGCVAVVPHHDLIDAGLCRIAREAGWRVLSYTVNTEAEAWRLRDLGVSGLITDAVDRFVPDGLPVA